MGWIEWLTRQPLKILIYAFVLGVFVIPWIIGFIGAVHLFGIADMKWTFPYIDGFVNFFIDWWNWFVAWLRSILS